MVKMVKKSTGGLTEREFRRTLFSIILFPSLTFPQRCILQNLTASPYYVQHNDPFLVGEEILGLGNLVTIPLAECINPWNTLKNLIFKY